MNVDQLVTVEYNQRLARLPVSNEPQFQVSDELIKLVDQVKERLKDEELEYFPSSICLIIQTFIHSMLPLLNLKMVRKTHQKIVLVVGMS